MDESAARQLVGEILALEDEEREELSSSFLGAVTEVLRAAHDLRAGTGVTAANVVHASLRSFAITDGAPPEDMPVLTAPPFDIDRPANLAESVGQPDRSLSVELPTTVPTGRLEALEQLLQDRRSMPYFADRALDLVTLSSLLKAAVGTRELVDAYNRRDLPLRRFPSAGGLQPVDVHLIARNVSGLDAGHYRLNPVGESLVLLEEGDFGVPLVEASIQTDWIFYAPATLILVGRLDRCFWKYGTRGYRFLNVDTGCAYMSLHLAAEALGLHGNALAAFDDDRMNRLLRLDGVNSFANLAFAVGHRPARWED